MHMFCAILDLQTGAPSFGGRTQNMQILWFNLCAEDGGNVATENIEFYMKNVLETHFSTD